MADDWQDVPASPSLNATAAPAGTGDWTDVPPSQPTIPARIGKFVSGQREFDIPQLVPSLVKKNFDLQQQHPTWDPSAPTMPPETEPNYRVIRGISASPTDANAHVGIIRSNFPDARFKVDRFGNVMANLGGDQWYYTNPSGLSETDAYSAMMQVPMAGPAIGGMGKIGSKALGPIGRVAGAGAGFGVQDAINQGIASASGSDQPLQPGEVGKSALVGMGAEVGASVVARGLGLVGGLLRSPQYFDAAAGAWTPAGMQILNKVGIDPAQMTPEMAMRFVQQARSTSNPVAALRQTVAGGLPVPIGLTTGQATRNMGDLGFESEAKKGLSSAGGSDAERVMTGQQQGQQEGLHSNVPAIQGTLSGGTPVASAPGQGAQAAQRALVVKKEEMAGDVDAAYSDARAQSRGAPDLSGGNFEAGAPGYDTLPPPQYPAGAIATMKARMRQTLHDYDPKLYVQAHRAVDDMPDGTVTPATVDALEQWRTRWSLNKNAVSNQPGQAKAIDQVIKTYDTELESSLKDDLLHGSPEVIEAWQNARGLRRRMGQIFGEDDAVNELTMRQNDGSRRLMVDPPDAVNYIFGRGQIGATNGLRADLLKLRSTLGADSPEWNAIREEAWMRLNKGQDPTKPFNAGLYNKNLNAALNNNPEAMNTLFTPDEKFLFKTFGQVASWSNELPRLTQNTNPSGTASTLTRIANQFGPIGNFAKGYVTHILRPGMTRMAVERAERAASGRLPGVRTTTPGASTSTLPGAASQPYWQGSEPTEPNVSGFAGGGPVKRNTIAHVHEDTGLNPANPDIASILADAHAQYMRDPVGAAAWDTMGDNRTDRIINETDRLGIERRFQDQIGPIGRSLADPEMERIYHQIEDRASQDAWDYTYNPVIPHRRSQ